MDKDRDIVIIETVTARQDVDREVAFLHKHGGYNDAPGHPLTDEEWDDLKAALHDWVQDAVDELASNAWLDILRDIMIDRAHDKED